MRRILNQSNRTVEVTWIPYNVVIRPGCSWECLDEYVGPIEVACAKGMKISVTKMGSMVAGDYCTDASCETCQAGEPCH